MEGLNVPMDDETQVDKIDEPVTFGEIVYESKRDNTVLPVVVDYTPATSTYYRKNFNDEALIKYTNCEDKNEAMVLVLQNQHLSELNDSHDVLLPNACILKLSNNKLTSGAINQLWTKFPSTWWLDLSHNDIVFLDCFFPLALGSLNLVGNNLSIQELKLLKRMHILKLKVILMEDITNNVAVTLCNLLPNAWVINNDFITYGVRNPKEAHNATFEEQKTRGRAPSDADLSVGNMSNNSLNNNDTYNSFDSSYAASITTPAPPLISTALTSAHFRSNYSTGGGGDWRVIQPNERELNIMRAVQDIPIYDEFADAFKLDILIEDYLEEASIFNAFARNLQLTNKSAIKEPMKVMPMLDIYGLLLIPHKVRLDLSVLLTTSILFPLPVSLLKETLTILLVKHMPLSDIEALVELPLYVRTGLVSIIRRISRRELEEINANANRLVDKPSREAISLSEYDLIHNRPTPTYIGHLGFNFIRPIKMYMAWPILDRVDASPKTTFSELELDILRKLPDIPTAAIGNQYINSVGKDGTKQPASYKDWISFACRHTVLLFNKSPSCPSLTRPQTNAQAQDMYYKLLPILKASNMTYEDLDISMTGVNQDGRVLSSKTSIVRSLKRPVVGLDAAATGAFVNIPSSLFETIDASKPHALSLEDSTRTIGGKYLPYGVGLPNATPKSLMWNDEEIPIARNYEKLWNCHLIPEEQQQAQQQHVSGDSEEWHVTDQFFVTSSAGAIEFDSVERGVSHRNPPVSTSPSMLNKGKLYSTTEIDTSKVFVLDGVAPQPLNYEHTTSTDLLTKFDLRAPSLHSPKRLSHSRGGSKHSSPDAIALKGNSNNNNVIHNNSGAVNASSSFEQFAIEVAQLSQENLQLLNAKNETNEIEMNDSLVSLAGSVPNSIIVSIQMPTTPSTRLKTGLMSGVVDSPMPTSPMSGEDIKAAALRSRQLSTNSFNLEHDDEMNDSVASGLMSGQLTPDPHHRYHHSATVSNRTSNNISPFHPQASIHSLDTISAGITVPSISIDINMTASSHDPLDLFLDSKTLPASMQHASNGNNRALVNSGKFQTLIPAKISGYSADAKWSSSFILAPPQAVQQYNTLKVITNDELNCWENLEFAPVVVTSPTVRIPLSKVQQQTQQQMPSETMMMTTATQQQTGGNLPAQSPLTIATNNNSKNNFVPFSPKQAFSSPSRQHARVTKTLAESIREEEIKLLREMGTTKNVFDIRESQKLRRTNFKSVMSTNRSLDEESMDSHGFLRPESKKEAVQNKTHISAVLVKAAKHQQAMTLKYKDKIDKAKKNETEEDTVFLTGVVEEGEAEDLLVDVVKPIQPVSELQRTFQEMELLRTTVSSLDVLKVKHKYGNIYTNNFNTEFGYVTEGGKHLDATWYPCFPKSMYRLKASASVEGLLSTKKSKQEGLEQTRLKRQHSHQHSKGNRKNLTPIPGTLFQNSVLTKVPYYTVQGANQEVLNDDPNILPSGHRRTSHNELVETMNSNLKILSKSCTFLKDKRLLTPLEYNDDSLSDHLVELDHEGRAYSKPVLAHRGSTSLLSIAQEVSAEYIQSHPLHSREGSVHSETDRLQQQQLLQDNFDVSHKAVAAAASYTSSFNNGESRSARIPSPASLVMNSVRNDLYVPPVTPTFLKGQGRVKPFPEDIGANQNVELHLPASRGNKQHKRPSSSGGVNNAMRKPRSPKGSPKGLNSDVSMSKSFTSTSLVLSVNTNQPHHHKKKTVPHIVPSGRTHPSSPGEDKPDNGTLTVTLPMLEMTTVTLDNETTNSAVEASAIYDAYSGHLSATHWDVMDDNSSVDSSQFQKGPRSPQTPTGLITHSLINRETAALPNFGVLEKRRSVDSRHRSQQLVGHSESPWVGRNHYKAATHAVQLNRTFRYQLPSKKVSGSNSGIGGGV